MWLFADHVIFKSTITVFLQSRKKIFKVYFWILHFQVEQLDLKKDIVFFEPSEMILIYE